MFIPWITVVWMRFQFLIFRQIFIFKLLPSIIYNFSSYLFCQCFQCWFDSNQTSFLTLLRLGFQTCATIIYHIINNHRMLYNFSFQENPSLISFILSKNFIVRICEKSVCWSNNDADKSKFSSIIVFGGSNLPGGRSNFETIFRVWAIFNWKFFNYSECFSQWWY